MGISHPFPAQAALLHAEAAAPEDPEAAAAAAPEEAPAAPEDAHEAEEPEWQPIHVGLDPAASAEEDHHEDHGPTLDHHAFFANEAPAEPADDKALGANLRVDDAALKSLFGGAEAEAASLKSAFGAAEAETASLESLFGGAEAATA